MLRFALISLAVGSVAGAAFVGTAGAGAPATTAEKINVTPSDWPWWRGPNRDGIASADQKPPLHWSETQNVLWKAPLPGRGHGSPTVVGDQVFLEAADEQQEIQSVVCFDRLTGKQLWKNDLHKGSLSKKDNKKSSHASSTIACDGERLFVNFLHDAAIYATALNRDGKQVWQKKISEFTSHQGFGASPALYQSLVIFSADNKGGGVIAGLDRASGETVWRHERPKLPNYTSPIILKAAGREQLIFVGCDLISSFEPLTGKRLWEVPGATTECVTSTVTDGEIVMTSGGYPKDHMSAVRADGSGTVVWENSVRMYVPSPLIRDGYLYGVTDAGVAICWKSNSGKELWKSRLGGTFSASPVMVGDRIFAVNEEGKTFVFKASPEAFELIAENQLGDEVFATPTICGSRIYLRVAVLRDGRREETLYCLGQRE
ncbi:MAG: PQQ-binding-like beta-propeller repeat protein [Planctomycetia bacterium]|nr:PQQ-binding-like beta-propeller repeat protein [Planctomycetia bacterium]